MKFAVHEKQMKARLGAEYDLSKYTEGVDYKRQKTGFGSRVMFRSDILGSNDDHVVKNANIIVATVVDPSLVEHKQDKAPVIILKDEYNSEQDPVIVRPAILDDTVRSARVTKKYANQRYVETDTLGRVFVGEKGHQIKMSQIINVKNGSLYLQRT
jgi:hypothetical protein